MDRYSDNIKQVYCLHNHGQIMITVAATIYYIKSQIDFCRAFDLDFFFHIYHSFEGEEVSFLPRFLRDKPTQMIEVVAARKSDTGCA